MISYVQSNSNVSLSGNSVGVSFSSNIAQGNGLLASVLWIDTNNAGAAYPNITVADAVGAWKFIRKQMVPLGGDIWLGVFGVNYCDAGPNGTITATADAPGLMIISAHEIAPNSGEIFAFGQDGAKFGIGFNGAFSDGTDFVQTNSPQFINAAEYYFVAFATRTGNINPTSTGVPAFTNREYAPNATPVGGLGVLGSLATLDAVTNAYPSQAAAALVWSMPGGIVAAVIVGLASIAPVANLPTATPTGGEYAANQSVVLENDQGLDIRYTTDGTTPTGASTLYTAPIPVSGPTMRIKAFSTQPATGFPPGFWTDSAVQTFDYDIFTGVCTNPNNAIDGDDSTFAELICGGPAGDTVAVETFAMAGTTGAAGNLNIDFEVTQNDLVAPSQTLPAWKVVAKIAGVETVIASAVPGAGLRARGVVQFALPSGTDTTTVVAKVAAICEIPASTGGVRVKLFAAFLSV